VPLLSVQSSSQAPHCLGSVALDYCFGQSFIGKFSILIISLSSKWK